MSVMERLMYAAILRDGHCHGGAKSHAEVRRKLGDENPYEHTLGDTEGFVSSRGQFYSRYAAIPVGVRAGQLDRRWLNVSRELLSSDIDWEGKPAPEPGPTEYRIKRPSPRSLGATAALGLGLALGYGYSSDAPMSRRQSDYGRGDERRKIVFGEPHKATFISDKPLSKRAKRRQRGRAS